MIAGHQPALGPVLAQLLRLQDDTCTVLKGAAWWLRQSGQAGETQTMVWAVCTPDSD